MRYQLGAMTVGDILDRGVKTLTSRLSTFLAINLIFLSPTLFWSLAFPPARETPPEVALGQIILALVLTPLVGGAVLHVIGRDFAGRPVGLGSAVRVALARFWSLFGTGLLFYLLFFVVLMTVMIGGMVIGFVLAAIHPLLLLVYALFFLAALVGSMGVIFVRFYFFGQVVVMEGVGGPAALVRSKDLSWGFGWRIFGVYVLFSLIYCGAMLVASLLNFALPGTEFHFEKTPEGMPLFWVEMVNYNYFIINTVVTFLMNVVAASYLSVCQTLLYFDLRIRKEGLDLEMAARNELPEAEPVPYLEERPPVPEDMSDTERSW